MGGLEEAAKYLKDGKIVIFPTDTVYGIGCRIGDLDAIKRLYNLKERKPDEPTLILAKDLAQAKKFAYFDKASLALAKIFWPGQLTIVTKARKNVPKLTQAKDGTIGIRTPDFKPIQKIIQLVGEPILAPSANFRGFDPPITYDKIDKRLIKLVDYVLDVKCGGKIPSTVVEALGKTHRILREGAISKKKIQSVLKGD